MSVATIIKCGGTWHEFPCRAFFPSRKETVWAALKEAWAAGWSSSTVDDFCPAHTRRHEGRILE